ncbi:hypothetical protein WDU94_013702 [Cyamophila willieti]
MFPTSRIPLMGGLSKMSSSLMANVVHTPSILNSRSTYILERARPLPRIYPRQRKRPYMNRSTYVYKVVQQPYDRLMRQQDLQVILVQYVEGLGKAGDIVTVNPNYAYNNLLLPKLAIYASPENLANASLYKKSAEEEAYSSKTSKTLMRLLPYHTIPVVLNQDNEWTIEPWHIKASARKVGIHVLNEASIQIPGPPIRGPDQSLHGKDFIAIFKVNNKETIKMRCKIFIWATKPAERNSIENQFWCFKGEPVHPEVKKEDLDLLPIEQFNPDKIIIPSVI